MVSGKNIKYFITKAPFECRMCRDKVKVGEMCGLVQDRMVGSQRGLLLCEPCAIQHERRSMRRWI